MSVSKIWAVHENVGSTVSYIENPDKTFDKTENMYSGFEDILTPIGIIISKRFIVASWRLSVILRHF